MKKKPDNKNISKVLGQVVDYPDQYDPTILVKEPRQNNRDTIDLKDNDLPFVGYDTWNAYEVSSLLDNGMPTTGTLKIVYPCNSKYIVESKSIKLYLNSFNMYRCSTAFLVETVKSDLSKLLETEVQVYFNDNQASQSNPIFSLRDYITLERYVDTTDQVFNIYQEDPSLLEYDEHEFGKSYTQRYHSALLKSNCRVTSQPDWGDVYVYMKSQRSTIGPLSLLKYIISFRDECHFHEEICETIYKRLNDIYEPEELCVTCLYARRGGIDINPTRASHSKLLPNQLIDPKITHCKTLKQ